VQLVIGLDRDTPEDPCQLWHVEVFELLVVVDVEVTEDVFKLAGLHPGELGVALEHDLVRRLALRHAHQRHPTRVADLEFSTDFPQLGQLKRAAETVDLRNPQVATGLPEHADIDVLELSQLLEQYIPLHRLEPL
jgi:hypothetical protein